MSTIVRFFQDGGAFMYPILLVFAFGAAIAIERWMYLTMSGASNRALWKKIVPFLKAGNFQEAAAHTSKSKAAIGGILTYGLYRVKSARHRDDIEKAMEESMMEVSAKAGEAYALHRDSGQRGNASWPAGYDYRPDQRVYGRVERKPGGQGRHALGQYLGGDEHDGIRSHGCNSVATRACLAANEDKRSRG